VAFPDDAYADVVADVAREWREAAEQAFRSGLAKEDIVFDPGLGFAKTAQQSLELCARLSELVALGFPVLVGPSRKSFVAHAASEGSARPPRPGLRLGGSLAAALTCAEAGAAILRVHDVLETRQAIAVMRRIRTLVKGPIREVHRA
jgi:dihydropteroate synthase